MNETKESLHYLLMANHLMVQKSLITSVKDTGLTPGQPKVLDYLRHHDALFRKRLLPTAISNQLLSPLF